MTYRTVPEGKKLIFRKWRIINNKRVYASEYGLKAFPIIVDAS